MAIAEDCIEWDGPPELTIEGLEETVIGCALALAEHPAGPEHDFWKWEHDRYRLLLDEMRLRNVPKRSK